METDTFDCDVLVAGLGPVGATLAALLATHGVNIIAIDRDAEVYPLPRAVHFDHEIMRLFQQLGLADQLGRHTLRVPPFEFRTADGQVLLSGTLAPDSSSGWATGYHFHQPSLEMALRDLLTTTPQVDVRLGWRLEGVEQDSQAVTATISSPQGPTKLRARYLAGCDGGSSVVRGIVGGGLFDYAFDEPWLVIDAKVAPGARLPEINLQICDPKRPTTCIHSAPNRHRWEFMLLPDETPQMALQDDFIQSLLAPWDCGAVEIERRAVYRFHGLVANRWRTGRVLLAGDSAHQMPPFAGQGLCSGLRDAANLAWKLRAVLEGRADPQLLDSYQLEREPHVRSLIELTISLGRVVCTLDEQAAAARDQHMLGLQAAGAPPLPPIAPGPFAAGCVLPGAAGAGALFPQPTVGAGPRRLRLDDALGHEAWLISREPFQAFDDTLLTYHLGEEVLGSFRAALTQWLDDNDADAVLVRPDRYIFGLGAPADLAAAWAQALRPLRQAA